MGMLPQQTRMEVIANNMANASTTGFKRSSVFERNLIDAKSNFYNVPGDAEQNDPPTGEYTDYSQGSYEQTNNPLDVAIETQNGFFLVQDQDRNSFLTRSGNFKLSDEGYIVTYDGKNLMGNDQTPLRISKEIYNSELSAETSKSLNINIDGSGRLSVNEKSLGAIQLVNVSNLESLEQISSTDFIVRSDTNLEYLTPEETAVRQGWIEDSNVSIVNEMVAMIELQRMFEAGSKVIQTNDGTLDRSIRLGTYQ